MEVSTDIALSGFKRSSGACLIGPKPIGTERSCSQSILFVLLGLQPLFIRLRRIPLFRPTSYTLQNRRKLRRNHRHLFRFGLRRIDTDPGSFKKTESVDNRPDGFIGNQGQVHTHNSQIKNKKQKRSAADDVNRTEDLRHHHPFRIAVAPDTMPHHNIGRSGKKHGARNKQKRNRLIDNYWIRRKKSPKENGERTEKQEIRPRR